MAACVAPAVSLARIKLLAALGDALRRSAGEDFPARGTADMEDHETRRKIIRQWMALPKDKRQTAEQAAGFAKRAVEQSELEPSVPAGNWMAVAPRW